jgi:phosphoenolpyruvate phosphomutase
MLSIGGKPILRRLVDELKRQEVNDITVVAGYRAEAIDASGVRVVLNRDYEHAGELASLCCARPHFRDELVLLYGDLLFRSYILRDLLDSDGELTAVVDSALPDRPPSGSPDYAYCTRPDDRSLISGEVLLTGVASECRSGGEVACGRWIGVLRARAQGRRWLEAALAELETRLDFPALGMPALLSHLVAAGRPIRVLYIHGHWLDVNSLEDLERAGDFALGQRT